MINKKIKQLHNTYNTYDVTKIANKLNIDILYTELDIECFGITVSNNRCKTIIINNNIHPNLQEFTLAHELGHCVLHNQLSTPFMRKTCSFAAISKLEAEAHRFAFAILSKRYEEILEMTPNQVTDYFQLPGYMTAFMQTLKPSKEAY